MKSAIPSLADADELFVNIALGLVLGVASEYVDSVQPASGIIDNGRCGTCVAGEVVAISSCARPVDLNLGDLAGDKAGDVLVGSVGDKAGDEADNVAGGRPGDKAGHEPGGNAGDGAGLGADNVARGGAGDENGDGDAPSCADKSTLLRDTRCGGPI